MRRVRLITQEIARRLPPIRATEGRAPEQIEVAAKFFTPSANATWFITEGNLETGELFGLCDLGQGFPELGYVSLEELEALRGPFGLPVERDRYWSGTLAEAAREVGYEFARKEAA